MVWEKQKEVEVERALSILFLKCRQKNPLKECPFNCVGVCALYEHDHPTNLYQSLHGLKELLKGTIEVTKPTYFLAPKKPW